MVITDNHRLNVPLSVYQQADLSPRLEGQLGTNLS